MASMYVAMCFIVAQMSYIVKHAMFADTTFLAYHLDPVLLEPYRLSTEEIIHWHRDPERFKNASDDGKATLEPVQPDALYSPPASLDALHSDLM